MSLLMNNMSLLLSDMYILQSDMPPLPCYIPVPVLLLSDMSKLSSDMSVPVCDMSVQLAVAHHAPEERAGEEPQGSQLLQLGQVGQGRLQLRAPPDLPHHEGQPQLEDGPDDEALAGGGLGGAPGGQLLRQLGVHGVGVVRHQVHYRLVLLQHTRRVQLGVPTHLTEVKRSCFEKTVPFCSRSGFVALTPVADMCLPSMNSCLAPSSSLMKVARSTVHWKGGKCSSFPLSQARMVGSSLWQLLERERDGQRETCMPGRCEG